MKPAYVYRAIVERVVDGDTVDVMIDVGFHTSRKERLRLFGIDAWETRGEERERGLAAKQFLKEYVECKEVVVETIKDTKGKYGRYLAVLWVGDIDVNALLITLGHAVEADY